MNKYPIGIQDFGTIRTDGNMYVDKTRLIYELITGGKYYFLSRPRRFGKSLLLSTIKAIFEGKKELFTGLWIENNWNWNKPLPVIHLKLSSINYQDYGLKEALSREISAIAAEKNLLLEHTELKDKFKELIVKIAAGGRVVILVDEYDKPIIDYLNDMEMVSLNKSVFKSFYSVLKDADPYVAFLLITGVSKFSKVSIFSDLNKLEDLTLTRNMNNLVGITQQELETNFAAEITHIAALENIDSNTLLEQVRYWYNGYSWGGKDKLYNPFSLLCFVKQQEFKNFWFETGTPTFLINAIVAKKEFDFKEVETGIQGLSDFIIEDLQPAALMFQTGYLTIKKYNANNGLYLLGYPNKEVKQSILAYLIGAYRYTKAGDAAPLIARLIEALDKNDIEKLTGVINTSFASIPYDLWRGATELHYYALVHLLFSLLGVQISSEVHTSNGRCDAIVQTLSHIYAFEFKLDGTASAALQQISDRGYLVPFATDSRVKVAVGISFSSETKKVGEWEMTEMM